MTRGSLLTADEEVLSIFFMFFFLSLRIKIVKHASLTRC